MEFGLDASRVRESKGRGNERSEEEEDEGGIEEVLEIGHPPVSDS